MKQCGAWIAAGRDYSGATVMGLPEYQAFEEALRAAFPERFQGNTPLREFEQRYAFPLIEAAIARSAERGLAGRSNETSITESVDEFVRLINRERDEAVAARVITDITVETRLAIGSVEIRPVGQWGLREAFRGIGRLIPGTAQELDSMTGLFPETFHFSVLVARATAPLGPLAGHGYYSAAQAATSMISTALAAIRLATAATTQSTVEVISPPGYVRLRRAQIIRFDFDRTQLIQHMGKITSETAPAIAALAKQLPTWSGDEKDPHTAGIALARYDRSFLDRPWYDTVVDMGVGLEAALLGGSDTKEESVCGYAIERPRSLRHLMTHAPPSMGM